MSNLITVSFVVFKFRDVQDDHLETFNANGAVRLAAAAPPIASSGCFPLSLTMHPASRLGRAQRKLGRGQSCIGTLTSLEIRLDSICWTLSYLF